MPSTRSIRPPARLHLTEDSKEEWRNLRHTIVKESVEVYDKFVKRGRQVPKNEWEEVKTRELVTVYKEIAIGDQREPSRPTFDPGIYDRIAFSTSQNETSTVNAVKPDSQPLLMATGLVDGRLEDYLLGALTDDEGFQCRMRKLFIHDKFDAGQTLAVLDTSTEEDCFQYLGIRWFLVNRPLLMTVTSPRDYIAMEGMGIYHTDTGDRIGYHVIHTVENGVQPLPGVIRGEFSFCFLMKQIDHQKLEIYSTGFSDPKGKVVQTITMHVTSQTLLMAPDMIRCGLQKKLQFLMEGATLDTTKQRKVALRMSGKQTFPCKLCMKCVNPSHAPNKSYCQICCESICVKCSVKKRIAVKTTRGKLVQKQATFCLECIVEANSMSARSVVCGLKTQPSRLTASSSASFESTMGSADAFDSSLLLSITSDTST